MLKLSVAICWLTKRNNPESVLLQQHLRENLRSRMFIQVLPRCLMELRDKTDSGTFSLGLYLPANHYVEASPYRRCGRGSLYSQLLI
jgi:hypothetical protein